MNKQGTKSLLSWYSPLGSFFLKRADTIAGTYRTCRHPDSPNDWFWYLDYNSSRIASGEASSEDEVRKLAEADFNVRLAPYLAAMKQEMIISAACKIDDMIVGMAKPKRHCDIIKFLSHRDFTVQPEDQGFMTSSGNFVNRSQAYLIALAAKQISEKQDTNLYTEDLW